MQRRRYPEAHDVRRARMESFPLYIRLISGETADGSSRIWWNSRQFDLVLIPRCDAVGRTALDNRSLTGGIVMALVNGDFLHQMQDSTARWDVK